MSPYWLFLVPATAVLSLSPSGRAAWTSAVSLPPVVIAAAPSTPGATPTAGVVRANRAIARRPAAVDYLIVDAGFTNNDNQNMGLCAAGCFAATYVHRTVPYVSMDAPRSVRLIYHGDRVAVRPFVYADVSLASGTPTVDEYWLEVKVNGAAETFLNGDTRLRFSGSQQPVRLAGQFSVTSLATGIYSMEITVGAVYGNGTTEQSTTNTSLMVVNERTSPIARGWTIGGVQRLYFPANGFVLITDGAGSGAAFVPCITVNCWGSPTGDFSVLTASGTGTGRVYTRAYPDSTKARFNHLGQMTSLADRFGNTVQFGYDGSGRLTSITDPIRLNGTSATILSYGTRGLASIREPGPDGTSGAGRTTTVTVASDSTLRVIKDPDGDSTRFAYDGDRRLSTVTDRRGSATSYHYNALSWKLDSLRLPEITVGSQTLVRPRTKFEPWQTAGVPTASTQTTPATPTTPGVAQGRVTNPRNKLTTFTVDRWGQPLRITDAAQRQTTITRSGIFPSTVTSLSGGVDSMTYAGPFLTSMRSAGQNRLHVRYGAFGQADSVYGTGWAPRRIFLGASGRVDSVRFGGADSLKSRYSYDSRGRVLTANDPSGHTTSYRYDTRFGNLDSTAVPGNRYSIRRFDGYGRDTLRRTSGVQSWQTTSISYDAVNRVREVDNPTIQSPTSYSYDQLFLTRVEDANGNVHRFTRNALGWMTQEFDPADTLNRYQRFEYDANGNVTARINRRGQQVAMVYDNVDRLLQKSGTGTTTDSFGYPYGDRVVVASNTVSVDSMFLAPSGWTDSVVTRMAGQRFRRHYLPTALLQRDSLRISSSNNIVFTGRRYLWNSQTNLLAGMRVNGQTTALTRNRDLLPVVTTYPSGVARTDARTALHRVYRQSYSNTSVDTALWRGYGLDVGNRLGMSLRKEGTGMRGLAFGYDGIERLGSFDSRSYASCAVDTLDNGYSCGAITPQVAYSYDAGGNVQAVGSQYTAGNRIAALNGTAFEHDLDGHVSRKSSTSTDARYFWGADGRLDSVTTAAGGFTRYDYNALGQLVRRWSDRTTVDRHFLWDGDELLAELNGGATQRVAEYASWPGADQPLAMITGATTPTLTRYVAQDQLGSVVGLMNGTAVEQQAAHDAWGNATVSGDATNRRLWKGLMWEGGVTGLYYMRNRWYDPGTGRFASEDPIGLAGGLNLYTFGGNDPTNSSDPLGLCTDLSITFTHAENGSWVRSEFCRDAGDLSTSVTIIADPLQELGLNVSSMTAPLPNAMNSLGEWSGLAGGVSGLEAIAGGDWVGGGLAVAMALPIGRGTRAVGGVITGFTKHGRNQAISREGVGVAAHAILDAVRNPTSVMPGNSPGAMVSIGQHATVIVNASG